MKMTNFLQEMRYYTKLHGFARPFKKYLLYSTPLSRIVNTPLYNKLYTKRILKKAKIVQPKILQIETTNACNAKCKMCPHIVMERKVHSMSFEDFKTILDNVMKHYPIERVTMSGLGEPFLDRGIIEKIKYVNQKYPKVKIDIYSNGSLLSKQRADELLTTKVSRITFSVNGSKDDYNEVMKLDYENTKNNVIYFLEQKRKLKHPVLTNISMMLLKENEKSAKGFVEFWKGHTDSVRTYFAHTWTDTLKESLGDQSIPFGRKQWTCDALWTDIVVHSTGEVLMCCRDYDSAVVFGNLLKGDDIKKIRESKRFKELQEKHLKNDFSSPLCENCDHSYDSSIEWWMQ